MLDLLATYWLSLLVGAVLTLAILAYRALRRMSEDVGGPGEQRYRHGGRR